MVELCWITEQNLASSSADLNLWLATSLREFTTGFFQHWFLLTASCPQNDRPFPTRYFKTFLLGLVHCFMQRTLLPTCLLNNYNMLSVFFKIWQRFLLESLWVFLFQNLLSWSLFYLALIFSSVQQDFICKVYHTSACNKGDLARLEDSKGLLTHLQWKFPAA